MYLCSLLFFTFLSRSTQGSSRVTNVVQHLVQGSCSAVALAPGSLVSDLTVSLFLSTTLVFPRAYGWSAKKAGRPWFFSYLPLRPPLPPFPLLLLSNKNIPVTGARTQAAFTCGTAGSAAVVLTATTSSPTEPFPFDLFFDLSSQTFSYAFHMLQSLVPTMVCA